MSISGERDFIIGFLKSLEKEHVTSLPSTVNEYLPLFNPIIEKFNHKEIENDFGNKNEYISVTVKSLKLKQVCKIDVERSITVEKLKHVITNTFKISADKQRLVLNGQTLHDDDTLSKIDANSDSIIYLFERNESGSTEDSRLRIKSPFYDIAEFVQSKYGAQRSGEIFKNLTSEYQSFLSTLSEAEISLLFSGNLHK